MHEVHARKVARGWLKDRDGQGECVRNTHGGRRREEAKRKGARARAGGGERG